MTMRLQGSSPALEVEHELARTLFLDRVLHLLADEDQSQDRENERAKVYMSFFNTLPSMQHMSQGMPSSQASHLHVLKLRLLPGCLKRYLVSYGKDENDSEIEYRLRELLLDPDMSVAMVRSVNTALVQSMDTLDKGFYIGDGEYSLPVSEFKPVREKHGHINLVRRTQPAVILENGLIVLSSTGIEGGYPLPPHPLSLTEAVQYFLKPSYLHFIVCKTGPFSIKCLRDL